MSSNENNPFKSGPNEFGLPEGYFQQSAGSILNKIEWQEEHKLFPALLACKDKNGFSVPEVYFDKNVLKLELLETPFLEALPKARLFRVPENYFDNSELQLLSDHLVFDTNELQNFENLKFIPKKLPFKTAENYFAKNEEQLNETLLPEKEAKRIFLFSSKAWYAAAAALFIAVGVWTYSGYFTSTAAATDCGSIACLDKTDLIKTKTLELLDNEDLYELVNSKQLEEHLNPASTNKTDSTKTDSSSQDAALDDLPDGI